MTAPTARDSTTWHVSTGVPMPLGAHDRRRMAHDPNYNPRDDVVELRIDRGLSGRRLDHVPLELDEAVALATGLLVAVKTIRDRQARYPAPQTGAQ